MVRFSLDGRGRADLRTFVILMGGPSVKVVCVYAIIAGSLRTRSAPQPCALTSGGRWPGPEAKKEIAMRFDRSRRRNSGARSKDSPSPLRDELSLRTMGATR